MTSPSEVPIPNPKKPAMVLKTPISISLGTS